MHFLPDHLSDHLSDSFQTLLKKDGVAADAIYNIQVTGKVRHPVRNHTMPDFLQSAKAAIKML